MARNDELLKKMKAGNFIQNNGAVIRAINILRHEYARLKSVRFALTDLTDQEFLDCVNFLHMEGYIFLRDHMSKTDGKLSDSNYTELEAIVTGKGIRLLGGTIDDDMVDV